MNKVNEKRKEVFNKTVKVLKQFFAQYGSSLMVSVAYMDPGNYATGITAGASNKFSLLFIVFISNVIAIFLQSLCIKLGTVTGYDLARCLREYFPRWLNIILWFLAECAIIATDVAEVIGSAIALNVLLKIPLPAGVAITIVDVLFVLMAYRNDTSLTRLIRIFEYIVGALVLAVTICFAVELSAIPGDSNTIREVFLGFLPNDQMFKGKGMTIATSIIGSTVMIHSLFLGSGLVQPRLREYDVTHGLIKLNDIVDKYDDEKKDSNEKEADFFYKHYKPSYQSINHLLKYSIAELVITLFTFALFVNSAILIVAGATLYGTEEAIDADLYTIHDLLSRNLAPAIGTVFMLALLFSGQSAGIVCTIAGQMVSEGHINWTLKPWIRRLVTRGISIVPCLVISLCIGRGGLNAALNISQVVISILLPPLTLPLIYFTCKKSIMRIEIPQELQPEREAEDSDGAEGKKYKYMHNNWLTSILVIVIWLFVSVLNVYAIVQMAMDGVD
ncbi:hypothetical protein HYPBUDRAFT_105503 [Hyphopichia burtonii NRRL Y-1933]|uniref:Natural resistance-associated macrophage protein n=1 Tax=Hyphopichia burtonii NRRL Y-1933 TaxID=984485 RepID=A0A1E4RNW7_9ASCO|nr:hypothetical protein HYPBUDRAFT_105503 [Hyphopichia burtonii NRRL Y-1933]ODV68953.1 hypothetical protein HYPBUDRAFT_105503 [Hyphopichia burtonii NRRL Y-1933]